MGDKTAIEWTDATWNPIRGCSIVSEGCKNCYAMQVAARFSDPGMAYAGLARRSPARWTGVVATVPAHMTDPLRWARPRRIFVNSMSDLFHESLADSAIDCVFAVMALAHHHTFQVLTKRADRMRDYLTNPKTPHGVAAALRTIGGWADVHVRRSVIETAAHVAERVLAPIALDDDHAAPRLWPLQNVWFGVSVENQERADERIPLLLKTPAAVRFLSVEPLLGTVDLHLDAASRIARFRQTTGARWGGAGHPDRCVCQDGPDAYPGTPHTHYAEPPHRCARCSRCSAWTPAERGISWVIVGGESGPGARPCDVAWLRRVVEDCRAASVPCFVKQLGARPYDPDRMSAHPESKAKFSARDMDRSEVAETAARIVGELMDIASLHLRDKKGGDPSEWPEDLRVRQFPAAKAAP